MNEKNNTYRLLKDEVPLTKSVWCRFGIHNWTMWSNPEHGIYKNPFTLNRSKVLFQFRNCGNCNKIDRTMYKLGTHDDY